MVKPLNYTEAKYLKRGDYLIIPEFLNDEEYRDVYFYDYNSGTDEISVIYNIGGTSYSLNPSNAPKLTYIPEDNDHLVSIFYACIGYMTFKWNDDSKIWQSYKFCQFSIPIKYDEKLSIDKMINSKELDHYRSYFELYPHKDSKLLIYDI